MIDLPFRSPEDDDGFSCANPWDREPEITCKKCGKRLVLERDIDDWSRPISYYRDPDDRWDKRHDCKIIT